MTALWVAIVLLFGVVAALVSLALGTSACLKVQIGVNDNVIAQMRKHGWIAEVATDD